MFPVRYRCLFTVLDAWEPSEFLGSTWRGALGHSLRRVLCAMPPRTACESCTLRASCLYPLFYDTPILPEGFTPAQMKDPPRPFVLEPDSPPEFLQPGSQIGLNIVLFGESNEWLPAILRGLAGLASQGLGYKRQARVRLSGVWQQDNQDMACWYPLLDDNGDLIQYQPQAPVLPTLPQRLKVQFITPLRMKRNGQYLTPGTCSFNDFAQAIYRRVVLLKRLYGGVRETDYPALPIMTGEISQDLHWVERERHSNRQKKDIDMSGITGSVLLDGTNLEPVWEALYLGQWLHAGSGCMMGLGGYVLDYD
jgi:hypothetical protein